MGWVKGQTGNPHGRPKGKKDQFTQRFWNDIHDAWKASGTQALKQMIEHNPTGFVRICASVLPQDDQRKEISHAIEVTLKEPEWLRLPDTRSEASTTKVIDIIADKDSEPQDR